MLYLVHDICHGSPIGAPLLLLSTTNFPNLPLACLMPNMVTEYINEEVALGCMAGPFMEKETNIILRGHFHTVPVGLVEKDPEKVTYCYIP